MTQPGGYRRGCGLTPTLSDQYLGIRNQKSGGDEIGSGRDISRNFYFLATQMRFGMDR